MGMKGAGVITAVLALLICQILAAPYLTDDVNDLKANEELGREKRGLVKGLLIGGAVYGGAKLAGHAIKKRNPCAFHDWGVTDRGEMSHAIAANSRCQKFFEKNRNDLGTCSSAMSATCMNIEGHDNMCSVQMADGTYRSIMSCV